MNTWELPFLMHYFRHQSWPGSSFVELTQIDACFSHFPTFFIFYEIFVVSWIQRYAHKWVYWLSWHLATSVSHIPSDSKNWLVTTCSEWSTINGSNLVKNKANMKEDYVDVTFWCNYFMTWDSQKQNFSFISPFMCMMQDGRPPDGLLLGLDAKLEINVFTAN